MGREDGEKLAPDKKGETLAKSRENDGHWGAGTCSRCADQRCQ